MYPEDLSCLRCPLDGAPLQLREAWEQAPGTGELLLARVGGKGRDYLVFGGVVLLAPGDPRVERFSARLLERGRARGAAGIDALLRDRYPLLALLRRPPEDLTLEELLPRWLPERSIGALMTAKRVARLASRLLPAPVSAHGQRWRTRVRAAAGAIGGELQRRASGGGMESPPCGHSYLAWRTSLSSFYAAATLLGQLEGELILDLGAGAGHLAHLIGRLHPRARLLCIDRSLASLLVTRWFSRPGARDLHLLCDASRGLPLEDGVVDSAFSCDALHFLADQPRCVSEVSRVVVPHGQVVLSCLREADHPRSRQISFGRFRSLSGWRALLSPLGDSASELWSDDALAEACLADRASVPTTPDGAPVAAAYSFVRRAADITPRWLPPPIERGSWRVNPIYEVAREGEELVLERSGTRAAVPDLLLDPLPRRWSLPRRGADERVAEAAARQIIQPAPARLSARSGYWRWDEDCPARA